MPSTTAPRTPRPSADTRWSVAPSSPTRAAPPRCTGRATAACASPTGRSAEAVGQLTGLYLVRPDDLDDLADVCGILAVTGDAGEARAVVQPEGGQ